MNEINIKPDFSEHKLFQTMFEAHERQIQIFLKALEEIRKPSDMSDHETRVQYVKTGFLIFAALSIPTLLFLILLKI